MFAYYYDLLMSDIDYRELLVFLKKKILLSAKILDAGCGSGNILVPLLKDGYNITGLDSDEGMIEIIKTKCQNINKHPKLILGDLREPMSNKYECIIAMFDVINYFSNPKTVLTNLYQALEENGILIFDIYKEEYLQVIDGYLEIETKPLVYTFKTKVTDNVLHHELKVDSKVFKITQFVFKLDFILNKLKEIGFKKIETHQVFDERKEYIVAYKA